MNETLNIDQVLQSGMQHHQAGRFQQAESIYRQVLELEPENVSALHMLGVLMYHMGRPALAIESITRAIQIDPACADAHNHLGNILREQGRVEEAMARYEQALRLAPNNPGVHNNIGIVMQRQGRVEDAVACYRRALEINPDYVTAHNNLGLLLHKQGDLDVAIEHLNRALALQPDYPSAHNNLASVFRKQGKVGEALLHYREAIRLEPNFRDAYNNLLLALNYVDDCDPGAVLAEHREFARRYAQPLSPLIKLCRNNRDPDRRLKIGYVSGDFKRHSVAHFIEPVLVSYDREQYEVYCYYNHQLSDEVTRRLQSCADHWRMIAGMSDERVAKQVQDDEIDILVDLSGHTRDNRLLTFAMKPAPVQVTWLGYPNTTGLPTMDYRITDSIADPVGMTEHLYTERLVRLPEIFSCYRPPREGYSEVGKLPLLRNGYVTFGSFNNSAKITPNVMALWAQILTKIPNSRLVLRLGGHSNSAISRRITETFASFSIAPARLGLLDTVASMTDHLERYNQIDIGLDPFPYNGTTTNCEALWMGVPVIALAGRSHVSRVTTSQLSNLGLFELIARTPDEYIEIAVNLATDADRLKVLRASLRERMGNSPLMNAERFTRNLEAAYRQMWKAWCATDA
ncbi:MAG: O-linked N-acetylglucosamine transferase, SPINDLY family protein [Gammaproteobacteria bacterium]